MLIKLADTCCPDNGRFLTCHSNVTRGTRSFVPELAMFLESDGLIGRIQVVANSSIDLSKKQRTSKS